MSNRENTDQGFYCSEPFCDGDHVTSTATCEDEFDGAPVEQWEVTEPADVHYTEDYWGDGVYDSYETYLNR